MKKLIPVGFYRELSDDPEEQRELPSITEFVSASPQIHEDEVVAYLRNGVCLGARGGYVSDVLDPEASLPLVAHSYTDGTYIWRLDLAHYVEKHHVRLPPDFLAHMASMNWKPPTKVELNAQSLELGGGKGVGGGNPREKGTI